MSSAEMLCLDDSIRESSCDDGPISSRTCSDKGDHNATTEDAKEESFIVCKAMELLQRERDERAVEVVTVPLLRPPSQIPDMRKRKRNTGANKKLGEKSPTSQHVRDPHGSDRNVGWSGGGGAVDGGGGGVQPSPEFRALPNMVHKAGPNQSQHMLSSPCIPNNGYKGGSYGWSKEEDMRLTDIIKKYDNPLWVPIAKEHNCGRSAKDCHERWIRYLKPGLRENLWTDHEDAIVVEVVTSSSEQPFRRWSDLEKRLPGRLGKQIRDRWVNHLNPNINHLPFSGKDDLLLWEGHKKLGKRWVEISTKYFNSSRSENQIKNRWHTASFKKFISESGLEASSGDTMANKSRKRQKKDNGSHPDDDKAKVEVIAEQPPDLDALNVGCRSIERKNGSPQRDRLLTETLQAPILRNSEPVSLVVEQPPAPGMHDHHGSDRNVGWGGGGGGGLQPSPEFRAPASMVPHAGPIQPPHFFSSPYIPNSGYNGGSYGWSKEEDLRLTEIVKNMYNNPRDWVPIAKEHYRGRSAKECHERWIRYLRPGLRENLWTDREDAIVMEVVTSSSKQPFKKWSDLAKRLPGRSGKQIRDRWVNHLNPNINHLPFSRKEDLLLWDAQKERGKRWVEISNKYFNSARSESQIKNRWYSSSFKKFISEFGVEADSGSKMKNESPKKTNKDNGKASSSLSPSK